MKFRCAVTNSAGTVYSDAATLTVNNDKFTLNEVVYQIIDSSTARVYKYNESSASLTIPQTVNNLTVVEVGEKAFENKTSLESIVLPDSITLIAARAFAGCTALSTMNAA